LTIYTLKMFVEACKNGDLEAVQELLSAVLPVKDIREGLRWACWYGYTEIVDFIVTTSLEKPSNLVDCLHRACINNHPETVVVLLPHFDQVPDICMSHVYQMGHKEVQKLLVLHNIKNDPKTMHHAHDIGNLT